MDSLSGSLGFAAAFGAGLLSFLSHLVFCRLCRAILATSPVQPSAQTGSW